MLFKYIQSWKKVVSNFTSSAIIFALSVLLFACNHPTKDTPLFEALSAEQTGIQFENKLHPNEQFNMFHYMYYYNGAGVGTGDFNNDGQADIFFASNEGDNQLYLNKGKLQFTEVSKEAQIPQDSAWNTGVSVVDINNDGLLDIYICRLGNFEKFVSKNQLLICVGIENGIPKWPF